MCEMEEGYFTEVWPCGNLIRHLRNSWPLIRERREFSGLFFLTRPVHINLVFTPRLRMHFTCLDMLQTTYLEIVFHPPFYDSPRNCATSLDDVSFAVLEYSRIAGAGHRVRTVM